MIGNIIFSVVWWDIGSPKAQTLQNYNINDHHCKYFLLFINSIGNVE